MFSWLWEQIAFNATNSSEKSCTSLTSEQRKSQSRLIPCRISCDHPYSIQSVTLAFDKYILSGCKDIILIHNLLNGAFVRDISGSFDWVNSISIIYGPTTKIVSAHGDGVIRLWDYFDPEVPVKLLRGHVGAIMSIHVYQGPNPRFVSGNFLNLNY